MYSIVLVSTSKNRCELLSSLGLSFAKDEPLCDEDGIDGDSAQSLTQNRAKAKAESLLSRYKNTSSILVACDTAIEQNGVVLGKPKNAIQAEEMIRSYSKRFHSVVSSICCIDALSGMAKLATSISKVYFTAIQEKEIEGYIKSGEWRGVAGGYKVQGKMGFFIERIEGSYSGIVGLPLHEFYRLLKELLKEEALALM